MAERQLIVNVGERDVWYNVGTMESPAFLDFSWDKSGVPELAHFLGCAPGARHVGAAILDRLAAERADTLARCRFPIVGSLITHLAWAQPLDRVVLVATDQPTSAGTERDRDSLNTAAILQHLIAHHYGDPVRVRHLEIAVYSDHPGPHHAYRFFGALLSQQRCRYPTELHVSISGGIPPLNTALQQQVFRLYPKASRLHQVVASTPGLAPVSDVLDVRQDEFIHDLLADVVERLVKRWDYGGALEAIRPYSSQVSMQNVERLLNYGAQRSALRYAEALNVLPQGHEEKRPQLKDAAHGVLLARAVEAYHLMEVRRDGGRTHDMLWLARAVLTATRELKWKANGDHTYVDSPKYSVLAALREEPLCRAIVKLANLMLHDMEIPGNVRVPAPKRSQPVEFSTHEILQGATPAVRRFLESWMKIDERSYRLEGHPYAKLNDEIRAAIRAESGTSDGLEGT